MTIESMTIQRLEAENKSLREKIEEIRYITKHGGYLERGMFEYERVIPVWELERALGDKSEKSGE